MVQIFDTSISDENNTSGLELTFELRKECDGQEQVLKEYNLVGYIELGDDNYNIRNSFLFNYCDDLLCSKECCHQCLSSRTV